MNAAMCTVVILRRPGHPWPLLMAANRDEMLDRAWSAPARHWPDRPDVTAGRDDLAGGTWLGINDHGVVAAILNRRGSLGPERGYRTRGELPLEALDHADAASAAAALSNINPDSYRPFNMVIADAENAYWLRVTSEHWGPDARVETLPEGVSMVTASDRNDTSSARIRTYLPQFEKAAAPDPGTGDWSDWIGLMASRVHDPADGPEGAMSIIGETGFGTVSSSLIALPSAGSAETNAQFLFATGRPGSEKFEPVAL